jgi:hypothetical protein
MVSAIGQSATTVYLQLAQETKLAISLAQKATGNTNCYRLTEMAALGANMHQVLQAW